MAFGKLGLGLNFTGSITARLTDLVARGYGDSTMEYNWSQYTAAGEAAFIAEGANYYPGTVTFEDGAKSGSYLSSLVAIAAGATVTNRWVNDTTGTLADGAQITANVVGLGGTLEIAPLSIGINDHSSIVAAGVDATEFAANFIYVADRSRAVRGNKTMLRTLGRDTGGSDAGANIVRESIKLAIASGGNILRGVDWYDKGLTDPKHGTQETTETVAEREVAMAAYYTGNSSVRILGPSATAELRTDEIYLTLTHVNGTDITAPSAGNGGIDATDDGTQMGSTALTRVSATTMKLAFPQGKAPVVGSVVKVWTPYGANGTGLNQAAPDVAKDNSSWTLPIQSDIVTATNGDPFQTLSALVLYWDARGSVKTLTAGTELDGLAKIAGSVSGIAEVAAGDHATWSASGFKGKGSLLMRAETDINYSAAFTAGGTHCIMMALKMPASMAGANSNMAAFANSGGSTDTQARWTFASDNALYWTNNEASAAEKITPALTGSQVIYICHQFVDINTCNVYIMIEGDPTYTDWSTPYKTFDPRNTTDYESQTYITIGGRSAAEDGTLNLEMAAWAHTTSVLSSSDRATCLAYWISRFT
jgi:hypothetical protein